MKALGFNFSKISTERFSSNLEGVSSKTNMEIFEVIPVKGSDLIKTKDELIGIKFGYTIDYSPDYAKIEFKGDILIEVDPRLAKDIIRDWKDKKMPEDVRIFIFNIILRKSNIKALQLEDEMNFPLHIPLPFVSKENIEKKE